ncbi:hypothetical protein LTR04_004285 [Oleoguttula sp. CCFEE 6159]|nr:hypothetical protein LTR04_004285 [Oleoguttula sp. CCFEE 6159]
MVYDWDDKEQEVYRMYVEERKSLDEVMEHLRSTKGFTPSKRAYQTQFKRWDFPSKQSPAHKNEPLVARTKELWEKNTSQKEMLRILNEEGFEIKERELMRVRAKNRWLLRVPNGTKSTPKTLLASLGQPERLMQELEQAIMGLSELEPELQRKRKQRLEKLQVESDEKWHTRKRRRRTRGWAGLPADPPGPPRFPSETTIDESKAYLSLDNTLYRQIRDQFTEICHEAGVIKKTKAGPEKWQAVKDKLMHENPHLQHVFFGDLTNTEQKKLSLDVVCTDVTKRMRTVESRMTIADAKNQLGINPEESRTIREGFYGILKADHFTSKLEAGDDHWNELKQQWIAETEILRRILAPGDADPKHQIKVKAMEVLCRDVMKRLRDDQAKRDPSRKKQVGVGPGPGPAPPRSAALLDTVSHAQTSSVTPTTMDPGPPHHDFQIDPTLLLAAASETSLTADQHQALAYSASNYPTNPYPAQTGPIPTFFRLDPLSQIQNVHTHPKVWLGALSSGSLAELRHLAGSQKGSAAVVRIEGVVQDLSGNEMMYRIDRDDELVGYLSHVSGGKATFLVLLADVLHMG